MVHKAASVNAYIPGDRDGALIIKRSAEVDVAAGPLEQVALEIEGRARGKDGNLAAGHPQRSSSRAGVGAGVLSEDAATVQIEHRAGRDNERSASAGGITAAKN